jgi:hypothetical protein
MKRVMIRIVSAVLAAEAFAALPKMPVRPTPDAATLKMNAGRELKFMNPLPRQRCGGKTCGTYNNREFACPGLLTTQEHDLGDTIWNLRKVVWADRRLVAIDGRYLMCQLNWIRDHVHQMKGFCHWEHDLTSFLDFILDTQRADGQFFELIKQIDDPHWMFVPEDCSVLYPEDNQSLVRLELEADIEYLMVEGCVQAWRVTGDDEWLKRALPRLEKGIDYQTSDVKRWDPERGLCKRPYTIDTWDFTKDPGSACNRSVVLTEPMAIMHGDNTGVYQAMSQLAWINERFGNAEKAAAWRARAATLRANAMRHLWNGKFFIHQLAINCEPYDENEAERLSMSDAYALNRGMLTRDECRSIIEEYKGRRATTKAFAEWFTIDPPYNMKIGNHPPGEYVNGAICPFTAGELAKGAFENGFEKYGWDILQRLVKMIKEDDGKLFFLYHPTTRAPQGRGPSAWGAAAVLSAIDQGLAGITDLDKQYRRLRFAPRWAVTDYTEGRYLTGYERAAKFVDTRWVFTDRGLRYRVESPAQEVVAHILLSEGRHASKVLVNGVEQRFTVTKGESADYVDLVVKGHPSIDFEVLYE